MSCWARPGSCPGLYQPPPIRILFRGWWAGSLYHPVKSQTRLLVINLLINFPLSYLTYWLSAGTNIVLAPGKIPSYFTFDLDLNSPLCSASAITLHNFCVQHHQTDVTEIAEEAGMSFFIVITHSLDQVYCLHNWQLVGLM